MYLDKWKIGRIGNEYEFDHNPVSLDFADGEISKESRNKSGAILKNLYRFAPEITLRMENYTVAQYNNLVDLKNDIQGKHWLLVNDSFSIIREYRTSESVNNIKLINASRANITIVGVWLASDYVKAGTNYYTSGSFLESTLTITLGTPLASAHTDVIIEYTYQGWYVKIAPNGLTSSIANKMGKINIDLTLRGDNG